MSDSALPRETNETASSAERRGLRVVEGGSSLGNAPEWKSWGQLLGALALGGGHGLFLFLALTQLRSIPTVADLGGPVNSIVVAWLVFCFPATFACLFFRRALVEGSQLRLKTMARVAMVLTAVTFVAYLRKMTMGG